MEEFELRLVTRHFKHAIGPTRDAVLSYVNRGTSAETARVNHACMLGYNWDAYSTLREGKVEAMIEEFRSRYERDRPRIEAMLNERFSRFREKRLRFEIFIVPFTSVDEFRKAFLESL